MSEPDATTTPKTHITNAVSNVIQLPEQIEHIGLYLQPSDLFSCIQVNRLWKNTLVPLLWHTINTLTEPWLRIINDDFSENTLIEEIEEWVHMVVAKHGRHIQDLTVHWNTVLETVSFYSECKNLRSLDVVNIRCNNGFSVPFPSNVVSEISPATINARRMTAAVDHRLPWEHDDRGCAYGNAAERYFLERIWTLLRQNPYLARLSLPYLGSMHGLPQEFIIDSLMSLHHLRDLNVEWLLLLDSRIVLRSLPKLERVHVCHLGDLLSLLPEERFRGLRMLGVRTPVTISYVLKVLEYLPGLEELRLQAITLEPIVPPQNSINAAAETRVRGFPAVKMLQQASTPSQKEDKYMAVLVGQLPQLLRIKVPMLLGATEQALWERCYFLEEIDSLNGGSKICRWRVRRELGDEDEDEDDALEVELA